MRYRVLVPLGVGAFLTVVALWVPVAVVAQAQSGKPATPATASGKTATPATPNALSGGTATTAWFGTQRRRPGWTPPRTVGGSDLRAT